MFANVKSFFGGSSQRGGLRFPKDYGSRYPSSRDCKDIDCNAESCRYNMEKKCSTPSRAEIDKNGKCLGFKVKGN